MYNNDNIKRWIKQASEVTKELNKEENANNKYSFYNSNSLKILGKKSLQSFLGNRFFKIGYVKQNGKAIEHIGRLNCESKLRGLDFKSVGKFNFNFWSMTKKDFRTFNIANIIYIKANKYLITKFYNNENDEYTFSFNEIDINK